jgi:hypothetical protein
MRGKLLLLLSLMWVVGCGGELLDNTYFDEWCNDLPCGWKLESGSVDRVETWHEHDDGAALLGTPTQLSQHVRERPASDCLQIELVAEAEPSAQLWLRLDFDDDGVDWERAIVGKGFVRHTFSLRPPLGYESVRYVLSKQGAGRAVIGKLSARHADSCADARLVLPSGANCASDEACSAGRCHDGRCASCARGTCESGQACYEGSDCAAGGSCAGGVCVACASEGRCALREPCTRPEQCQSRTCVAGSIPSLISRTDHDAVCGECSLDPECPSGHCVLGFCASCAADADCTGGLVCRYADALEATDKRCLPRLERRLARGELCEESGDCELGLSCGAAPGRAKRCGVSCAVDSDCMQGVCAIPGVFPMGELGERAKLASFESAPAQRVATCWPVPGIDRACSLHQQCAADACCAGRCSDARIDRTNGMCIEEAPP